jgi:hypothetical protein
LNPAARPPARPVGGGTDTASFLDQSTPDNSCLLRQRCCDLFEERRRTDSSEDDQVLADAVILLIDLLSFVQACKESNMKYAFLLVALVALLGAEAFSPRKLFSRFVVRRIISSFMFFFCLTIL